MIGPIRNQNLSVKPRPKSKRVPPASATPGSVVCLCLAAGCRAFCLGGWAAKNETAVRIARPNGCAHQVLADSEIRTSFVRRGNVSTRFLFHRAGQFDTLVDQTQTPREFRPSVVDSGSEISEVIGSSFWRSV